MKRKRRWVEAELCRLWALVFGEPPIVMGEPRLMLKLLRAARDGARRSA